MVALGDPLRTGLVDSLCKPSENVTGMSLMVPELAEGTRAWILSFLADPIAPLQVQAMEAAAPPIGLTLQVKDIRTTDDIATAFSATSQAHAEGALVTEESIFIVYRARVAEQAARHKLPVIYPFPLPVRDAEGLMVCSVRASELYRSAAAYVDRILKGAKPSDLPVQQTTQFELVINLKTANALGLTVPPTLLPQADEVIE
jgi:putative tryptophan/tyrosine transport system substrate-binding protein